MGYDHNAQRLLNSAAIADSQPGDYWHEMFAMVLLVVKVTGSIVWYVDEAKTVTDTRWSFDPEQRVKFAHIDDFRKRLFYKTESMADQTWADVQRGVCAQEVEFFQKVMG